MRRHRLTLKICDAAWACGAMQGRRRALATVWKTPDGCNSRDLTDNLHGRDLWRFKVTRISAVIFLSIGIALNMTGAVISLFFIAQFLWTYCVRSPVFPYSVFTWASHWGANIVATPTNWVANCRSQSTGSSYRLLLSPPPPVISCSCYWINIMVHDGKCHKSAVSFLGWSR